VVVPDGIVQAKRLVTLAPRVAGALVLLDHDRRDPELAQPRRQSDSSLSAADDHHLGLRLIPQLVRLAPTRFQPSLAVGIGSMHRPLGTRTARTLLVTLELGQRRQESPGRPVSNPQVAGAAADRSLKCDPGVGDPIGLGRLFGGAPPRRLGVRERVLEHVANSRRPLDGLDVPGERDQIAPEAVLAEQLRRSRGIAAGQRVVEARQPLIHLRHSGPRCCCRHEPSLRDDVLTGLSLPRQLL
jgi:hypothetical protein